jgi:putative acetyltransferase
MAAQSAHRIKVDGTMSEGFGHHFLVQLHSGPLDEGMIDLWQEAWQVTFPTIDFSARRDWFRAHVADVCAHHGHLLCVFDGQKLIGFALYDDERSYMDQLVLAPAYFGSGAGEQLLNEVRARVSNPLMVDVNQDNHRACRFYQRAGFVIIAEGRNERSGLATFSMRDNSALKC